MFKFFGSVREEMANVTWPTGKQLRKDVLTVLQTAILFAIFFGVVDYAINLVVKIAANL